MTNKTAAAEDMLRDLDRMKDLAGKEWSVAFAKKLGWSMEDIQRYLAGR